MDKYIYTVMNLPAHGEQIEPSSIFVASFSYDQLFKCYFPYRYCTNQS